MNDDFKKNIAPNTSTALCVAELIALRYRDSTDGQAKKDATNDIARLIQELSRAWFTTK